MERSNLLTLILEARKTLQDDFLAHLPDPVHNILTHAPGTATLRIMPVPEGNRPLAEFTRRPGGRISITLAGQLHHGRIGISPSQVEQLLNVHLQHRAWTHAHSIPETADNSRDWPRTRAQQMLAEATAEIAAVAVHDLVRNGTALKIANDTNAALMDKVIDPETARLHDLLSQDYDPDLHWMEDDALLCTVANYNVLAATTGALSELHHTNPALARFYAQQLAPYYTRNLVATKPAQLIAALKTHLQLSPPAWRIFAQTADTFNDTAMNAAARAGFACELLAKANAPDAAAAKLTEAVMVHEHAAHMMLNMAHADPWNNENIREAWIAILNRHLSHDGPPGELPRVASAFQHAFMTGLPWPPATWDELLARADEHHARPDPGDDQVQDPA